jgi:hypothetical protein
MTPVIAVMAVTLCAYTRRGYGVWKDSLVIWRGYRSVLVELDFILKNGVFWDVMPCGSFNKRRFGGT